VVTEDCKVTSAYVNALALDLVIKPLYACDSSLTLWLYDLEGNILIPFIGLAGQVASVTCRGLDTIIGSLRLKV